MTKEQVRLKAEELLNYLDNHGNSVADLHEGIDVIKAMLEFGVYIEELTKQRCLENSEVMYQDGIGVWLEPNSILNIPNICSNKT